MESNVNLEKFREALNAGNPALKKRALAIIFNEAVIEARPLVEEFLGSEPDSGLQEMAFQVLKKLEVFQKNSQKAAPEQIAVLLRSTDPSARVLGLRGLLNRRDSTIPGLLLSYSLKNASQEELGLIAQILQNNPDPANLPQLLEMSEAPEEQVRMSCIEGILNIMHGCLYPHVLKALLDPAPQIKMKAYKLIGKISRANLIDTLSFMISGKDPQICRLAGKLFPSFLGPDLLPLLKKHFNHPDQETAALVMRGILLLAQKGNQEASVLLEGLAKAPAAGNADQVSPGEKIPEAAMKNIRLFPNWLVEPLVALTPQMSSAQLANSIREVFRRFEDLLATTFVLTYLFFGKRSAPLNKICFKAFQNGFERVDVTQILRSLAPAMPDPQSDRGLFPLLLSHRLLNDFNDTLLEQIMSFHETFQVIEEHPEESGAFAPALVDGIVGFIGSLLAVTNNLFAVKFTDGIALKSMSFSTTKPLSMDPKISSNFRFTVNHPWLVAGDSIRGVNLFPFYGLNPQKRGLVPRHPSEDELWEFLTNQKILDEYMAFLKQKE